MKTVGSRAEVFHGNAKHTSGGLTKKDLIKNKHGRIVSKKKHTLEKKTMRLKKLGFGTQKGKFGMVKLSEQKKSRKSKKSRRTSKKSKK